MAYVCAVCGGQHAGLPDVGMDRPDQWWDGAGEERDRCIELSTDTCVLDGEHFFIRGVLEIPVESNHEHFGFGVRVPHRRENFETCVDTFESPDIGPFFGWSCTRIASYGDDTLMPKTTAHFVGGGLRPRIVLTPCEHPRYVEQTGGITLGRAREIVHFYDAK